MTLDISIYMFLLDLILLYFTLFFIFSWLNSTIPHFSLFEFSRRGDQAVSARAEQINSLLKLRLGLVSFLISSFLFFNLSLLHSFAWLLIIHPCPNYWRLHFYSSSLILLFITILSIIFTHITYRRVMGVCIVCTVCFAVRAILLLSRGVLGPVETDIYFFLSEIAPTTFMLIAFKK